MIRRRGEPIARVLPMTQQRRPPTMPIFYGAWAIFRLNSSLCCLQPFPTISIVAGCSGIRNIPSARWMPCISRWRLLTNG